MKSIICQLFSLEVSDSFETEIKDDYMNVVQKLLSENQYHAAIRVAKEGLDLLTEGKIPDIYIDQRFPDFT